MPVYEYRCTSCEKEFEYEHRMSDPARTVCEACGGALERLISRTSFAFKGGGWYKDLYASSKPSAGGDSGGSSSGGSSSGGTSSGGSSSGGAGTGGGSTSGGSSGGSAPPAPSTSGGGSSSAAASS